MKDINNKVKMSQEEFFKMIRKDLHPHLTFLLDKSSGTSKKYKMLSKKFPKVFDYDAMSITFKINELYNEMTGDLLEATSAKIKSNLISVDGFTEDFMLPFGFKEEHSIKTYNYYIESEMLRFATSFNNTRERMIYEEAIDFTRYPMMYYLLKRIVNPENPANRVLNKDGSEVDLMKRFLSWLSFCIRGKKNGSIYYLLISDAHGVGKGLFTAMIQEAMGELAQKVSKKTFDGNFSGELENKSFIIFDEAEINEKAMNFIKQVVGNPVMVIEGKGKDAKNVKNILNLIGTLNKPDKVEVENNDRRCVPLFCVNTRLIDVVEKETGYTMQAFLNKLEDEKLSFFTDVCNIDYDEIEVSQTPMFNDVKRSMIRNSEKTNFNFTDNLIEGDIKMFEETFYEFEGKEELENLLKEVSCGYLTNESLKFITSNIQDRDFHRRLFNLGKDAFWTKYIGAMNKHTYKKQDGTSTSVWLRKFKTFNKEKANANLAGIIIDIQPEIKFTPVSDDDLFV